MAENDIDSQLKGRVYHVGGYVRDKLLGRDSKDMDFVVVGSSPQEMLSLNFKKVGADFPVFISEGGDEYALARTERKTGSGYNGFEVYASPDVTLEDDLKRRDLTINAMAMDADGEIIDPFNGQDDLAKGILRHVSPSFAEDPVRVLRVARFAARYDFEVAPETMTLMRDIVTSGEMDALTPERVWLELSKSLTEEVPSKFFSTLRDCGALERVFPEVDALFGIPQPESHHPEIDTGIHTLMVLDQAAKLSSDPVVRFAALTHDLGKAATPEHKWPKHPGHEAEGVPLVQQMCDRLKMPTEYRDVAQKVAKYHLQAHCALEIRGKTVAKLFNALDAYRKPEIVERFLAACEADARGRKGFEDRRYPQSDFLRKAYAYCCEVTGKDVVKDGFTGEKVGLEMTRRRCSAAKRALSEFKKELKITSKPTPTNKPEGSERLLGSKGKVEHIGKESGQFSRNGVSLFHGGANGESYRFVQAQSGNILSALHLTSPDGKSASLEDMYTVASRRREGLATEMLRHALNFFDDIQVKTPQSTDGRAFVEANQHLINPEVGSKSHFKMG